MEGTVGWLEELVLLAGFVVAAFLRVPSRSERRWTLLAFAALAVVIAGLSPLLVASYCVIAALTVLAAVHLGWFRAAQPIADGLAAVVLTMAWALTSGVGEGFVAATPIGWGDMVRAAVVFVAWFLSDTAVRLIAESTTRSMLGYHAVRLLRDWPVAGVVFSLALTLGALWGFSPLWALLVSTIPYFLFIALYASLIRHEEIEWATVRALGRLPEAAGASRPGHSIETARLVTEMGKLGGYRGRDLEDLEKAALLHDLGLVFCSTSHVRDMGFTESDVARWSTELVGEAAALGRVGQLITGAAEPYRVPGAGPDPDIDDRSRLLAVACRVQELLADGMSQHHCIEALYEESRYRYAAGAVDLVKPSLETVAP